MHMNQVAFAVTDDNERTAIKKALGLAEAEWIADTVRAKVMVLDEFAGYYRNGENTAQLEFCMAMGGTQFELISYIEGPNWINTAQQLSAKLPFIAHVGFHLDPEEDWPPAARGIGATLVQEAYTLAHSNPEVGERRYHYRIVRIGDGPTYMKFIRRVHLGVEVDPARDTSATGLPKK